MTTGQLRLALCLVAAGLLAACEANVSLKRIKEAPSLPDSCQPQVFELGDVTPTDVELLAQVKTGDSFGTAGGSACSKSVVRELLRQQACLVGADAIKITAESSPSLFGSGCHKAKANLYRYVRQVAPPAPAPAAKPDKITRLKDLQKLHDEGAITDAEFQKLKREILAEPK